MSVSLDEKKPQFGFCKRRARKLEVLKHLIAFYHYFNQLERSSGLQQACLSTGIHEESIHLFPEGIGVAPLYLRIAKLATERFFKKLLNK